MKKTFITTALGLVLALALSASAYASIWTATTGVGVEYTTVSPTWSSGPVTVSASDPLYFNVNFSAIGSWDAKSDPNTLLADIPGGKKATWDWLTVNIYKNGALLTTQTFDDIDGGGNNPVGQPRNTITFPLSYTLAGAGVYSFQLLGHMTMGTVGTDRDKYGNLLDAHETWMLNAASIDTNPTPLPAAVWLLGSGLMGLAGFKRMRKNES